jgi:uncharacterized repeat protein (TIGR04138 family)
MSSIKHPSRPRRLDYHHQAYLFVKEALTATQEALRRRPTPDRDDDSAHISGRELLEGIRWLACRQFGMLAPTVFASWGVYATHDFGRIVFELVDMGELRRTEHDHLSDFDNGYAFDVAFLHDYVIDTSRAFSHQ